ncbi:hypothetical protein [Dickeya lacustris]|uniref:hypothetical protein n=1 Tax=Dickeya lacustris TaxID=2259638 RepID=UPI0013DDC458|nr:hypothetical protein [Dickeya lacustris]
MTVKANARIDLPLSYYGGKGNICYPVIDGKLNVGLIVNRLETQGKTFYTPFDGASQGLIFHDRAGTTATHGKHRRFSVSG